MPCWLHYRMPLPSPVPSQPQVLTWWTQLLPWAPGVEQKPGRGELDPDLEFELELGLELELESELQLGFERLQTME